MTEERLAIGRDGRRATFANGTSIRYSLPGTATQWSVAGVSRSRLSPGRLPADRDTLPEFEEALVRVGIREQETIHIDLAPEARLRNQVDGRIVVRPAPSREGAQVVLYIDESGGLTWHLPHQPSSLRARSPLGSHAEFVIDTRTRAAQRSLAEQVAGSSRGPITKLGRQILKVFVIPVANAVLGSPVAALVGRVERRNRQELIRTIAPGNYRQRVSQPYTDWKRLGSGRSLLLLHGIFSQTEGMLSRMPIAMVEELHQRYAGRIISFDHLTVSRSPEENARSFLKLVRQASPGRRIELDVLSHSRGGIVARFLAEHGRDLDPEADVRFRRVYFAASPNQGSPLADPDHLVDMIDVFTNLATSFPDGPVTYSLEVLLALVKLLVVTSERSLPGISAMGPGGAIASLNRAAAPSTAEYAAASADYQPSPRYDNGFFTGRFANAIMDQVFAREDRAVPNDLVVPRDGVFAANGHPSFPIKNRLVFDSSDRVWHTAFFAQERTNRHIIDFLGARERIAADSGPARSTQKKQEQRTPRARRTDTRFEDFSESISAAFKKIDRTFKKAGVAGDEESTHKVPGHPHAPPRRAIEGRVLMTTPGACGPGGGKFTGGGCFGGFTARGCAILGGKRRKVARPRKNGGGRPSRRPPPAARDVELKREPEIAFHELVEAGKKWPLVVSLADAPTAGRLRSLIRTVIKGDESSVTLSVILSAPGFKVQPRGQQLLTVGRSPDPLKEKVTFQLTALEPPGGKPVTREIRADFWRGNSALGGISHFTEVVPRRYQGPARGDGHQVTAPFVFTQARRECELVIYVDAKTESGTPPFEIRLRERIPGEDQYDLRRSGNFQFSPRDFSQFLASLFARFGNSFPRNGDKAAIQLWRQDLLGSIEDLGKWLWSRLPSDFQAEYFRLHDAGRLPASILIHSDETIIPWELVVPHRAGKKAGVLPPLGVAHVMGRWRPSIGIRPSPQEMDISSGRILNPHYAGGNDLGWSILEATDLRDLISVFQTVAPANRASVEKLLKRKDVQVLHFSGHGSYAKHADLSALMLESGEEIRTTAFEGTRLLNVGALIYLNACEVGFSGVTMGQMAGFAVTCLRNGCSGVIAPYWAVVDESARAFALSFYKKLIGGRSIGEALQELRKENRKDPTFLAFSFFGDPWTRLRFRSEESDGAN